MNSATRRSLAVLPSLAVIAMMLTACTSTSTTQKGSAMTDTAAAPDPQVIYDQRVVLEDVPRPHGSCSSLATLAAALQQRGEKVSYTYLMGASSRAFRLQFSWCPSAPHAIIGFDCIQPALKAAGYEWQQLPGEFNFDQQPATKATPEEQAQTRRAVKAAIDRGEAVMFGSEEDALLVGYEPPSEANPTGWLCRPGPIGPPARDDEPYVQPIKKMPWGLCTLKKIGDAPPRREAAAWAIRTALDNAQRGTVEGSELKTGFAAWQKWIDELEPEPFQKMIDETQKQLEEKGRGKEGAWFNLCLGNAWTYENLYFARLEAARYLRDIAGDMPEAARPHLAHAADAYEKAHHALVPEGDCFTKIAPFPWMLEKGKPIDEQWTDTMRQRQAALLREALKHERAAIDAIMAAAKAMD